MQGFCSSENRICEAMADLRVSFERRVSDLRDRSTGACASFSRCLHSSRAVADDYLASLEKLDKLKDELREGQASLAEALSVKTRNGARYTAMTKDLATKRARCEQIKNIISDQRNKVDECTTIVSKSLHALKCFEEKLCHDQSEKENLDSAIAWYQKALGLRVVVEGEGVKFIFNKIDPMNPDKEYSFTVQLHDNKYNLLQCDPLVEGIDDLLMEVNKTNDFFRFVRVMREKFSSSNYSEVKAVSVTRTTVSEDTSSIIMETTRPESSPVTPSVAKTGAKSKKGLKTPPSSIRRSARLRNV